MGSAAAPPGPVVPVGEIVGGFSSEKSATANLSAIEVAPMAGSKEGATNVDEHRDVNKENILPTIDSDNLDILVQYPRNAGFGCHTCGYNCLTSRELARHYARQHPECSLAFRCSKCNKSFNDPHGITCHYGVCKGTSNSQSQELENSFPFQCEVCESSFKTKIGLGQHRRFRHPIEANLKRIASRQEDIERKRQLRKTARAETLAKTAGAETLATEKEIMGPNRSKLWSLEEDAILIRLNEDLKGARYINRDIERANVLPGKSARQIQSRRKVLGLMNKEGNKPEDDFLREENTYSIEAELEEESTSSTRNADQFQAFLQEHTGEGNNDALTNLVINCLRGQIEQADEQNMAEVTNQVINALVASATTTQEGKGKSRSKKGGRKGKDQKAVTYRHQQQLYDTNRKKLAEEILDNKKDSDCPLEPKTVFETYSERLGGSSQKVDLTQFPPAQGSSKNELLLRPFSKREVVRALQCMRLKSAKGPDGVNVESVRRMEKSKGLITILLNSWLWLGKVPKVVKENRSILLPKGSEELHDIGNWRPLTISSVLLRLYTKLLASRLLKATPLNPRQRGFIKAPGCDENISLMAELIDMAKEEKKELAVAFLDLAKAFDTVSHYHVTAALERFKVDKHFIAIAADLYQGATTSFSVTKGVTEQIPINRGVKQGDPLSPILFLMAIDPLMCLLSEQGKGFEVSKGVYVSALAYADDTGIVSNSQQGMVKNLKLVSEFSKATGLKLNVRKSIGFHIKPLGSRSYTVNEVDPYYIDNEPLPWLNPGEVTKYLGARFDPWVNIPVQRPKQKLRRWLEAIDRASLKPRQKVTMLEQFACPRLKFHLATSLPPKYLLQELDTLIRSFVKVWLKLPTCTNSHLFYTGARDGGLGLTKLEAEIPIMVISRLKTLMSSKDKVMSTLAREREIGNRLNTIADKYGLQHIMPKGPEGRLVKRNWRKTELNEWCQLPSQGKGVKYLASEPASNKWLRGPSFLKEGEYIDALKLRANVYPTREASHRANGTNPMCRRCGNSVETVGHISGFCPAVKRARISRHNKVLDKLENILSNKGYKVWREPKFRDNERAYIPDIVAYDQSKREAMIVDPTIVWDPSGCELDKAARRKVQKYLPIKEQVKDLTGAGSVKIYPFVVGARGAWWKGNHNILGSKSREGGGELITEQGFPVRQVQHFCLLALVGTINLLSIFMDS